MHVSRKEHIAHVTDHHNIPTSRGGSDEEINISSVPKGRHSRFHERWAENRTPDVLTRLIALHSIGFRDKSINPQTLEAIFEITTMRNWARLYNHEALRTVVTPSAGELARRVARYSYTHVLEERMAIRNAIDALDNGGEFPHKRMPFVQRCMEFFSVNRPVGAIETLYTETHNGELCWTKPMHDEVRRSVLRVLTADDVVLDAKVTAETLSALERQEEHIAEQMVEWAKVVDVEKSPSPPKKPKFHRPHGRRHG